MAGGRQLQQQPSALLCTCGQSCCRRWQRFVVGAGMQASGGCRRPEPAAVGGPRLRPPASLKSCRRGSLRTMRRLYEPVVVGLAGMESEWPKTGLAGMGPMKYAEVGNHMPKICNYTMIGRRMDCMQFCILNAEFAAEICKKICKKRYQTCIYMQKICKYTNFMMMICKNINSICKHMQT